MVATTIMCIYNYRRVRNTFSNTPYLFNQNLLKTAKSRERIIKYNVRSTKFGHFQNFNQLKREYGKKGVPSISHITTQVCDFS